MDGRRNVAIDEAMWVRLKQRALDERVTLREVVERACVSYLGPVGTPQQAVSAYIRQEVARTAPPAVQATAREAFQKRETSPADREQAMDALGEAMRTMKPDAPVVVRCRRCNHPEFSHHRGEQRACGQMGCSCSRMTL